MMNVETMTAGITREDGKILVEKFETVTSTGHVSVVYTPVPADRSLPWDRDAECHLQRGQSYARLSNGNPTVYMGRRWVSQQNPNVG